jgi:hypothetical protein
LDLESKLESNLEAGMDFVSYTWIHNLELSPLFEIGCNLQNKLIPNSRKFLELCHWSPFHAISWNRPGSDVLVRGVDYSW